MLLHCESLAIALQRLSILVLSYSLPSLLLIYFLSLLSIFSLYLQCFSSLKVPFLFSHRFLSSEPFLCSSCFRTVLGSAPPQQSSESVSLSHRLKEQHSSADRNIERIENAEHRDADMCVCRLAPDVGESSSLCSHHYCSATSHIGVVIKAGVLQLCRQYLYAFCFEESDTFL